MKIVYFTLPIIAFCSLLFWLNLCRYIRTVIYHSKYQTNCKAYNYNKNIKFYRPVTRLFQNAGVNQIDVRNHAFVSEHLEEPDYEHVIDVCFEKAKATFCDRLKRPWYVIRPVSTHKSLLLNRFLSVAKWVLLFLLNRVSSNVLETLNIGGILVDMLVAKFPWINNFLNQFFPS